MKYQIKLRTDFFRRETTLGWRLNLAETIDEAKRRLDWKAATRARVVDLNEREIWRGAAAGGERQRLWMWCKAVAPAVGVAGLVVISLLEGI